MNLNDLLKFFFSLGLNVIKKDLDRPWGGFLVINET
jgi:hypothetical protein